MCTKYGCTLMASTSCFCVVGAAAGLLAAGAAFFSPAGVAPAANVFALLPMSRANC